MAIGEYAQFIYASDYDGCQTPNKFILYKKYIISQNTVWVSTAERTLTSAGNPHLKKILDLMFKISY